MADSQLIHPAALVESDDVGLGTRVWAFAHIMKGAVVGEDCKIGDHSFIETGAVIGDRVTIKNGCLIWEGVSIADDVFVGPKVVFTNDLTPRVQGQIRPDKWLKTEVAANASIGANCTILSGIRLGLNCMIGAGSVVTRSVPNNALVYGNPTRQHGWVCACGSQLDSNLGCEGCGRSYRETSMGLEEVA